MKIKSIDSFALDIIHKNICRSRPVMSKNITNPKQLFTYFTWDNEILFWHYWSSKICTEKWLGHGNPASTNLYAPALVFDNWKRQDFCVYAINRLSGIRAYWSQNIFTNEIHGTSRMLVRLGVGDPVEAFSKRELDDDLAKCKKRFFNHVLRKFKRLILGGHQRVGTVNKKSSFRWRVSEASEKKFYKQS